MITCPHCLKRIGSLDGLCGAPSASGYYRCTEPADHAPDTPHATREAVVGLRIEWADYGDGSDVGLAVAARGER